MDAATYYAGVIDDANGTAEGVMWAYDDDDGLLYPIFIIEDAKDIYDHIVRWSENQPQSWFAIESAVLGDKYALAFTPNLQVSLARFKANMKLLGESVNDGDHIMFIFKPIGFQSKPRSAVAKTAAAFAAQATAKVGFTNSSNVDKFTGQPHDADAIYTVKDIQVVSGGSIAPAMVEEIK